MRAFSKIVYCIPGLGQDERVFEGLEIKDAELRFINWIPAIENESISDYAKRLAEEIDFKTQKEIYLLGVSLGGMMAVEMTDIINVKKLILISTVKNKEELPPTFDWFGKIPVRGNSLPKLAVDFQKVLKPFYGKANEAGIELFGKMLDDTDLNFLRWAWNHIPKWKKKGALKTPFIHLHGTADLIFPIKYIDQAITLKGSTHFAIFNDKKKLNQLIELYL